METQRGAGGGGNLSRRQAAFLAAGAHELEGVNQKLGAQRDTAPTGRKKNETRSRGRWERHEEVASIKTLCACFYISSFDRRPPAELW